MVANVPFSPFGTTTAAGSFNIDSTGFVQGCALDQPAVRNALSGGFLAPTETLPMWGGIGITEMIPGLTGQVQPGAPGSPVSAPMVALGSPVGRATTLTANAPGQLTGFSVFDQNYAMVNSTTSAAPLTGTYGQVNFYRLGSGARIPVAIDQSLLSLQGGLITQQVSWDFNNQVLAPYESASTYAITTETWNNTAGGQVVVVAGVPTPVGAVGDFINISGATNTGTGGAAMVNGNFQVVAFTDNQHFTIALPATAGQVGTIGGTIIANYSVGALPVRILEVDAGRSMVVNYNPLTGAAIWNRSGSVAVILI